jgi:hypothetical protein
VIKPEEVSLVFGKWKEESTVLRVVAFLPCGYFGFNICRVLAFSVNRIGLELPGDKNACEFDLTNFVFEYGEPPSEQEDGVLSAVIALRNFNERFFFMETIPKWSAD